MDLRDLVKDAVDDALRRMGRVTLLIAGKSGVGKSTLVNAVFQGDFATTGQGRPVTANTREITKEGVPLTILDTRGLEVAAYRETLGELKREIGNRRNEADANRHVHVAWICIAEDSRRVEAAETHLAQMLHECGVPTLAVITKSRADQGFRDEVQSLLPTCRNVARVRALHESFDDGHVLPPQGLEALVELTMEVVPEGTRAAFAAAQRASLKHKRRRAHGIVASAALTAGGIGATPIPMADAVALAPVQLGMLAGISLVFGLPLDRAFLNTLLAGTAAAGGGTLGGRLLFSSLLKLVPGAGSVIGGVIAGSTAAALTTLFGEAYIAALSKLMENADAEQITAAQLAKAFKAQLESRAPASDSSE